MQFDRWTLALQAINALVLVWLLGRLLFRPVVALIAERRQAVADALQRAERARDEAARLESTNAGQRAALGARLAGLEQDAAAARLKAGQQAAAELERQLAERRAASEREAAAARTAAEQAGQADALAFSLELARRLLQRLPDQALVRPFVPGLATALGALPDASLREWCGDGGDSILRSARPLAPEELDACRTALQAALGTRGSLPALRPEVAPGLLAGLELESPHLQVRNHLHDDWQRLAGELRKDGDASRH